MRLPIIRQQLNKTQRVVSAFKGLDERIVIEDGCFSKMRNVSDRFFPALSLREHRGELSTHLTNPKAIAYKNGLFYIDGTNAYYKGVQKFTVTDTDKIVVGMGAYICVFPDGIVFNTTDSTYKSISASFTGNCAFSAVTEGSAFTKIACVGIDTNFKINDGIHITGANDLYNGYHVISEIGSGYIVIPVQTVTSVTINNVTVTREIPTLDFACELDNRLWGCSSANHEIYACALGDPTNWKEYQGLASSSYAVTVGSDGDFTGCVTHMGKVLFFKENSIHMMYGNKPANFSLNTKQLDGVRKGCEKSLVVINETLYYVGRNGVYAFDGATPAKISDGIAGTITEAVGCQQDNKYYLSCKVDGQRKLLVYDPAYQIWDVEDEEVFKFAVYGDGELRYIDGNNYLTTIKGDREEVIDWYVESGDIVENELNEKWISKIKVNLILDIDSEVKVFVQFDDEPIFKQVGYVRSTKNQTYTIPIIPNRCNKFRYRIEGRGMFKLLGFSREIEKGSELNGNLQLGFRR